MGVIVAGEQWNTDSTDEHGFRRSEMCFLIIVNGQPYFALVGLIAAATARPAPRAHDFRHLTAVPRYF
jgi:hypothetical protein